MAETLNWAALGLVVLTSIGLLISRDWRWRVGFLATQYLSAFWMIQTHWPISTAASKLVTGWMACAALGIAQLNSIRKDERESSGSHGRLFHLITACMVLAVTFAVSGNLAVWLGLPLPIAWGSLVIIGIGLLQLGITTDPFRVVIGLLSFFSGYEILYTAVESSSLVTALLAVVNLGLALAGAYFISSGEEQNT